MNILGVPYKKLGRGPDGFDCWGLVWYLYKEYLEIDIELDCDKHDKEDIISAFELNRDSSNWVRTHKPENLDVCLMYKSGRPVHIGVFKDGLILNSIEKHGVLLLKKATVKQLFDHMEFYKWQR